MSNKIKLVVADDHPILLRGLVDELVDNGYDVLKSCLNGADALTQIVELNPDIAILDLEMPLLSGFEVIAKASERAIKTKFIILTSHREKGYIVRARRFNMSGYILKDEPFKEVNSCIQSIMAGEDYFSRSFEEVMAREIDPAIEKIKFLSPSERTIVRLIAQGKTSKEIAELLSISSRTVEKHRANIITKLDLSPVIDALTSWSLENKELILSL